MGLSRTPCTTVTFVDHYCAAYQHLFPEVRSFENFKFLHLGMICEIPRKSLPVIARTVALNHEQPLLHFLTESPWEVTALRNQRLSVILAIARRTVLKYRKLAGINSSHERKLSKSKHKQALA